MVDADGAAESFNIPASTRRLAPVQHLSVQILLEGNYALVV
jgi:hypothetical protein